jgi:hypothetical protein
MTTQGARSSIYQPLDNARKQIRLLEILPTDSLQDERVRCRLSVCSLDDEPSFAALSYVWGDPDITRSVVVNDVEVEVTINLADALSQLQKNNVRMLWADALCIDQKNNEEKGHQVQMMKDIYQDAEKVIAWLGRGDKCSMRAIGVMEELAKVADLVHIRNVHEPYPRNIPQFSWTQLMNQLCTPLLHSPFSLKEADLGLVVSLMHRGYWTRLWILQEISLAKTATLLCGSDQIHWNTCQKATAVLQWFKIWFTDPPQGFEAFQKELDLLFKPFEPTEWVPPPAVWVHASRSKYGDLRLDLMLSNTCNDTNLECFNPRDRIYALFGLLPDPDRSFTTVDYSKSYVDLFAEATIFMLRQHGPRPLTFAGLANQYDQDTDNLLPSWVVDWRCTNKRGEGLSGYVGVGKRDHQPKVLENNKIVLGSAKQGKVIEVVPFTKDLRYIVEEFEHKQRQNSLVLPRSLKSSIQRTLRYNAGAGQMSQEDVDMLFEKSLQSSNGDHGNSSSADDASLDHDASMSNRTFEQLIWNKDPRNLFMTSEGAIGSGPPCTQVGDVVHAIPDLDVPVLLRPDNKNKDQRCWGLVGVAYVDGLNEYEGSHFTLKKFWATNPEIQEVILT